MRRLLLICGLVLLGGCFTSAPPNNLEFGTIMKPKELEGRYRNLGEGDVGSQVYLSMLIWPKDDSLNHPLIDVVEVVATSDSTLVVKAIRGDKLVKESTFAEGQDFRIESGRIYLKQEVGFLPKPQVPFLGPYFESQSLGVDQGGHGKYREQGGMAGLFGLFIPMAAGETKDVRFVRIRNER